MIWGTNYNLQKRQPWWDLVWTGKGGTLGKFLTKVEIGVSTLYWFNLISVRPYIGSTISISSNRVRPPFLASRMQ